MKTRDIVDLLAERPIVHPTTIESLTWRGRELVVTVSGYPWWEGPKTPFETVGTMKLVFSDVGRGHLLTDEIDLDDDEALENFEVQLVSNVPWAQACEWSIFCSSPMSEPLALYTQVHDFLSGCDAFLAPRDFLNQAHSMSKFVSVAESNGYLVARGPRCIKDVVCAELERQGVVHNVLHHSSGRNPKFLVSLGDSSFVCDSATAELPD
ncbi:MAG TPA: hypothetical protein VGL58_16145 [Caulobacteraceae bacterium]|jgi:hypothetical protein